MSQDTRDPGRLLAGNEKLVGTARKREEENLRRMATVVRDSNDAITIQDFEGGITAWNRGAERMYGYSEEEALRSNINLLTTPDKVAEQKAFIQRLAAGEDVTSFETQRVTKDGRVLDVWMTVTKLMDDAGKPIGLASTERDNTDRRQAEEKLAKSEQFLASVIEQNPSSTWISDGKGTMVKMNQACRELFGVTEAEVVGKFNILEDNLVEAQGYMPLVRDVFEKGTNARFTIDYDARDVTHIDVKIGKRRILDVVVSPIRDAQGKVTNAIVQHRDVTELRRAEEDRDAAFTQLQASHQQLGATEQQLRAANQQLEASNQQLRETERQLRQSLDLLDATGRMAKVGGWEVDAKTLEVKWTEQTYRLHEVPLDQRPPLDEAINFFHPEEQPKLKDAIHRALEHGEPYDMETRFITAKGNHLWTRTYCEPEIENGKTVRLKGVFQDITERKRAEAELRIRNQVFEDSIASQSIADKDGVITDVNSAFLRLWGYAAKEDAIGKSVGSFFANPADATPVLEALAAHDAWDGEFLARRTDGATFISRGYASSLRNAAGELIGYQSTNLDVSRERESEEALRESEARHRTTLSSVGDGVITTDSRGKVDYMNPVAERLTGWTEVETRGKPINEVFHIVNEETRAEVETPVDRVLREGVVVGLANHTVLIAKDGTDCPIADSGAPIRDETGKITGVVLVFRDQTEDRAALRALSESERKFREAIMYLDEGYYCCSVDGVLKEHNVAFNRILGFNSHQDLKGSKLPDFWQNLEDWKEYLKELTTTGVIRKFLINAKTIGGDKLAVMVNAHFVKDENGNPVRIEGTFTDFTDRKRMEEEIRKLATDLEQRVRDRTAELAAINRELEAFAYSVSHDLRAPLRAIDGFSQALMEDYPDRLDTRGKDYLSRVSAEAQRMAQLIDDLLMLSRVTRAEMREEQVNLTSVAQDVLASLRQGEPERQVDGSVADGLMAQGDSRLLRQVLENLLGNAWKFTGTRQKATLELGAVEQDGRVVYFVRDNGVGFDMKYSKKLFAPFQRLHGMKEFPGTGIGLSTVQRIVKRHGGRVWFESEPDKGTTCYFTLHDKGEVEDE